MCCDKSMTLLFGTEIVFYLEYFCISFLVLFFECRFFSSNEFCFYDFFHNIFFSVYSANEGTANLEMMDAI